MDKQQTNQAPKPKRKYKRLTHEFIVSNLMDYYETSNLGFKTFCNERGVPTKRQFLRRIADEVGLFKLKEGKVEYSFA